MKNKLYKMRDNNQSNGLIDLINYIGDDVRKMNLIEIGSYAGESTIIFSKYFKTVLSVDPYLNDYDKNDPACKYMDFNGVYEIFKNNIKDINNITHIRKKSDDAINDIKNDMFDIVYIDGLHTYDQVLKDINNYRPIIKEGGYISGHDYHLNWDGVRRAVNETLGKPDMIFSDFSWIKKI